MSPLLRCRSVPFWSGDSTDQDRHGKVHIFHKSEHGITPKTIEKGIRKGIEATVVADEEAIYGNVNETDETSIKESIENLQEEMMEAAQNLQFERAAELRDKIKELEEKLK